MLKKIIALVFTALLFFCNTYSQYGWFQQQYSSNIYNGSTRVFFLDSQIGWLSYSQYGYYGLLKTTNGGTNWFILDSNKAYITSIYFINQNTGWICSGNSPGYQLGIIYKTTNAGINWSIQSYPINESPVNDKNLTYIKFLNVNTGFACGFIQYLTGQTLAIDAYVLKTTNSGVNWTVPLRITTGEAQNWDWFTKLDFIDDNNAWVIGSGYNLFYRTTNGGNNWVRTFINNGGNYTDLKFFDLNTGYVFNRFGRTVTGWPCLILKTTNGGANFNAIYSTNILKLYGFYFIDLYNGWMCGDSNIIMKTTNGGMNWIYQNTPVFSSYNKVYFYNINTGWTISYNGHLLKTTTSGTTFIKKNIGNIPNQFSLFQNYPNPFNPLTRINFDIQKKGFVSLKVYDILGREVQVLVNEEKPAGSYSVDFNASDLTSGVYFYKLVADGFMDVKRMVLIK